MKEFEKWWNNNPERIPDEYQASKEAWRAALEWVLSNKEFIDNDYSRSEYYTDCTIIMEELK